MNDRYDGMCATQLVATVAESYEVLKPQHRDHSLCQPGEGYRGTPTCSAAFLAPMMPLCISNQTCCFGSHLVACLAVISKRKNKSETQG